MAILFVPGFMNDETPTNRIRRVVPTFDRNRAASRSRQRGDRRAHPIHGRTAGRRRISDDVLPYFRKSENWEGRPAPWRGKGGPLTTSTPDIQYTIAHASFKDPVKRTLDREPGLTIGPTPLRPEGRGSIHIKSGDPLAAPAIRPNFLARKPASHGGIGDRPLHAGSEKSEVGIAGNPPS
jgi:hypothetical protein